jgi:hypothetical protein
MVDLTTSVKHFFCINKILGIFFCYYELSTLIFVNTLKLTLKLKKKLSKKYRISDLAIRHLRIKKLKRIN